MNSRKSKENNRICTDSDGELGNNIQDQDEILNFELSLENSHRVMTFTWRCEIERWRIKWLQRDNQLFQVYGRTAMDWIDYLKSAPMLDRNSQEPLKNQGTFKPSYVNKDQSFSSIASRAMYTNPNHNPYSQSALEINAVARLLVELPYEDRVAASSLVLNTNDVEKCLDEQSKLLRQCLMNHAALQMALEDEKKLRLHLEREHKGIKSNSTCDDDVSDDRNILSLGDLHIIKELQLANSDLQARLIAKDGLIEHEQGRFNALKQSYLALQNKVQKENC